VEDLIMAMPIVIAKNQTAGDLALDNSSSPDRKIPASGQVTLSDYNTYYEIRRDPQLYAYIVADQVLLTIDAIDLTKAQSMAWMEERVSSGGQDQEVGNRSGTEITYNEGVQDYVEVSNTSWAVIGSFSFPGTTKHIPTYFKCITSLSVGTDPGDLRLYDFDNGNEIAQMQTGSSTIKEEVSTSTLSNLPPGEAIFEIQCKKDGTPGVTSKPRVHYTVVR
jgi:hypothetical protein